MTNKPLMRQDDWDIIRELQDVTSKLISYRANPDRGEKEYWTMYGQLTYVWVQLDHYMNHLMKDQSSVGASIHFPSNGERLQKIAAINQAYDKLNEDLAERLDLGNDCGEE